MTVRFPSIGNIVKTPFWGKPRVNFQLRSEGRVILNRIAATDCEMWIAD